MHTIYPTEESMKALTVFQIYEGNGEWFDLSKKPIDIACTAETVWRLARWKL